VGQDPFFLNFGYLPFDPDEEIPELAEADQPFRFNLQLYHHLLQLIEIEDREVLEVGCGQGGGCRYIDGYLYPKRTVGLDHAQPNLDSARGSSGASISYELGDAEAMLFDDSSFDIVICVEASHDFANVPRFLRETHRVLRSGGYLLLTDFRWAGGEEELYSQCVKSPLIVERWWDISSNVLAAVRADDQRRSTWLRNIIRDEASFRQMANVGLLVGTERHAAFSNGEMKYVSCVCRRSDRFEASHGFSHTLRKGP
jgi:ubiquinone/menaquinone biosynthesis C-methylase UbiE